MAWGITSRRSMTASRYHRRYRPLGVCIGEAGRHRRSRCSGKRICGAAGPRRNPCDRSLPRAGASRGRRGWRFAVAGRGAGITAPISGCSGASRRGIVKITGRGECEIGAWRPAGERYLPQVKELFMRAGVECRLTAQTAATLWKKLAINAAINPLTALLHVRNGALLELEELNPIVGMVVEEVWRVAARHQIALPTPPELKAEVLRVCRVTAGNRSSMLGDVEQRRPTEIDAINGAVARLGRERGILTPANELLAGLIRALSAASRSRPSEDGEAA